MVHRREVDGEPVVFGNQGALFGNALTMFDHDTGSVWSQPLGEAILGPLRGSRLELLPSMLTDWATWHRTHPETLALDVAAPRTGFALEQMVLVVELDGEAVAYPVVAVRDAGGVVNDQVGGVPIAVTVDPDGEGWAVFSRQLDDRVVVLELRGDGELVERDAGSSWNPATGAVLDGTPGEALDPLSAFTVFPADFRTFFPDGDFWSP